MLPTGALGVLYCQAGVGHAMAACTRLRRVA
jgi:hypothetical protein